MKKYILCYLLCLLSSLSAISNPKLQSLIIPGWGENTLGESKRSKNFIISESILWISFLGNLTAEEWFRQDYTGFAELHADVDMRQKSYLFAVNLGHYMNQAEYNDAKERQRLPGQKYIGENYYWEWDSNENRLQYDRIRIQSVTAQKYKKFAIAGLILNRFISLIDVLYLERIDDNISINSHISNSSNNISFNLSITFD